MIIDKIADIIQNSLDRLKTPAEVLPAFLLYYTAMRRPGLSPSKIAAEIISNNAALGINTGDNPDGTPNVVNQYTYNIVKCVVDAIKNDGVVQVAIPAGSIVVETNGANAGGPVVSVGTNTINTVVKGIVR